MRRRSEPVAFAVLAAVLYSSFLASYVVRGGGRADFVSELERQGAPYADWYRATDVLSGLALLALAWLCRPDAGARWSARWALVAVAVVGAASVLDGASTMDCSSAVRSTCVIADHSVGGLLKQLFVGHTVSGLTGFVAAGIGAACCARATWSRRSELRNVSRSDRRPRAERQVEWWMRIHIVFAAAIGLCGLADITLLLAHADTGLVERIRIVVVSLWFVSVPWTLPLLMQNRVARSVTPTSSRTVHP